MQSPEANPAAAAGSRLDAASAKVRAGAIATALDELHAMSEDLVARHALAESGEARLLALLIDCRLARGDLSDAMTLGDEITTYLGRTGSAATLAHHAKGELAAALGEPELAADHFLAAGAAVAEQPDSPELLPWRASAALVLVLVGAQRQAAELAAEHHRVALAHGSPYAVANALRTLAAADGGGQRVALLREARTVLAGIEARRLSAQVDADLAGLLVLTNDPQHLAEAVQLLRGAEVYAGQQELWPLQSRVRRLLDRCGEAPLRVSSEALALLTNAERRVSALAAAGLTNRQVAEELHVSVKAVEWHLSRTYRKLGIASRSGLTLAFGVPA
ncbi:MAG: LuxR C-terminal-related transcriptional regulator [Nocardioides sp.]|nr:LuxR C-terminal-related transcriptional regulator [Nocardioides sp.]